MKSIMIMSWSNIKSKKMQTGALTAVFTAVSILFFLSLRLFGTTGDYAELFVESNSSQSIVYASSEEAKDAVVKFLEEDSNIKNINILSNYDNVIEGSIITESESVAIPDVFFTELSDGVYDQIKVIEGKSSDELLDNEVIYSYGKSQLANVSVGDQLVITTDKGQEILTIAGLGVDLVFNLDTITLNRFWATPDKLEELSTESTEYSIGIMYNSYSKEAEQKFLDNLMEDLDDLVSDTFVLTHTIILEANSFFQVTIGAVFSMISVILTVVGLFIVRSIIFNSILTESKKIATLRSMGFSTTNVVNIYVIEYLLIGFLSVLLGIAGSNILEKPILGDMNEISNMFGLSNNTNYFQLIMASTLILLLITITVISVVRKISKTTPAVALNRGDQSSTVKQGISLVKYKKLSLEFTLAIKDVLSNKRMFFTLALFIIATSFTIVSLSSVSNSLNSHKDDLKLWIGYDIDASVVHEQPLNMEEKQEVLNRLRSSEYVEGVLVSSWDKNSQVFDELQDKYIPILSELFSSEDYEKLGFSVLDGRIPSDENEIMLARNLLNTLDKSVGDFVTVQSLGKEKSVLIVGEYQGFTNQGMSFRLFFDDEQDLLENRGIIYLKFNSDYGNSVLESKTELLLEEGGSIEFEYSNASLVSMLGILSLVTKGIIGMFSLTCLIVLLSVNLTSINKERLNFGIYKSVGMSNLSIIKIYLYKNLIISTIGIAIGSMLGYLCVPSILNAMTGSLGVNEFPYSISSYGIVLSILIVMGSMSFNTLIVKQKISRISPKELLEE